MSEHVPYGQTVRQTVRLTERALAKFESRWLPILYYRVDSLSLTESDFVHFSKRWAMRMMALFLEMRARRAAAAMRPC